jgi:hypothetical protein
MVFLPFACSYLPIFMPKQTAAGDFDKIWQI